MAASIRPRVLPPEADFAPFSPPGLDRAAVRGRLETGKVLAGQQLNRRQATPAGFDLRPGDCSPMSKAVKYAERAVTIAAQGAWTVFAKLNSIRPNPSFTPKWSDKPLLKSWRS